MFKRVSFRLLKNLGILTEFINDADTHLIYQYDYYNKKHGDKENIEIYTFGRKHLGLTEKEIHKYLFKMGDNQTYITDSSSY